MSPTFPHRGLHVGVLQRLRSVSSVEIMKLDLLRSLQEC